MKDSVRMIIISIIIAIASQINLSLLNTEFVLSAGIIVFVTLLFYYKELNPVILGVVSGVMVYVMRLLIYYIYYGKIMEMTVPYLFEILFYLFYSIIYVILIRDDKKDNMGFIYSALLICDFGANFIEGIFRYLVLSQPHIRDVIVTILIASLIRSTIIIIFIIIFKFYGSLLLKTEHITRYKKLLWLTSQFKSEMYWIEKNMDNVENVMNKGYKLYEKISNEEDRDNWANMALDIARDIHEIKKENALVVRGIMQITESELIDTGMNFKDITNILLETMKRETERQGKNIDFNFNIGYNFFTSKHYYLMSILRNLIMNSMDSIHENRDNGKIDLSHKMDDKNHIFIVTDNGSGIDEEGLKSIFSPGYSTKINYTTGEINRGLGLSVVQYIVENQLKGRIEVTSQLYMGTSFFIYIPKSILED